MDASSRSSGQPAPGAFSVWPVDASEHVSIGRAPPNAPSTESGGAVIFNWTEFRSGHGAGVAYRVSHRSAGEPVTGKHRLPTVRSVAEGIVPILAMAHGGAVTHVVNGSLQSSVVPLAELALSSDVSGAVSLVRHLLAGGVELDTLYLELVGNAARHLGQLWHDDRISFVDVTIGMLALGRLIREFDRVFCADAPHPTPERRMLLVPRPGESHQLASDLVSAFLRRAGWDVQCAAPKTANELSHILAEGWFSVLGISGSCDSDADTLGSCIRSARRASMNRRIRVIVGGPSFAADPDLAMRVGADATACDARKAVVQAEGLLALARLDG